jgi:hypothetical protein
MSPSSGDPDFAILLAASYRALTDELRAARLAAGLDDVLARRARIVS